MKEKVIKGYIGSAVSINQIFRWLEKGDDEVGRFKILDKLFSVMKKRTCKEWKRVEITIREVK